jgi:hypothetical protein
MLSKGEQIAGSHRIHGSIVRAHDDSAPFETPIKSVEDSMSNKDSPMLYPPRPFSSRGSTSMGLNTSGHAVEEVRFGP